MSRSPANGDCGIAGFIGNADGELLGGVRNLFEPQRHLRNVSGFQRRIAPDSGEPYLDDLDFQRITEGSHYTDFEVRDALESLVGKGFASKISPVPVARIVFKISPYGIRYLRSVWEEVFYSMEREKAQIESRMLYLREKLRYASTIDRELERRVKDELREFRSSIDGLSRPPVLMSSRTS